MSINFFKRGGDRLKSNTGDSGNNWDELGKAVPFGGQQRERNTADARQERQSEIEKNIQHQQNIIVLGLLGSENGRVHTDVIGMHGEKVSESMREQVYDNIANGRIGLKQERTLLEAIADPSTKAAYKIAGKNRHGMPTVEDKQLGMESVFGQLESKHQKRILSAFSGHGFNKWESASSDDLKAFLKKYPTPIDFEKDAQEFVSGITVKNGNDQLNQAKQREYAVAMAEFKNKVYGKRQEYWEQMKVMNAEAKRRGQDGKNETQTTNANSIIERRRQYEAERSAEKLVKDFGVCQVSKKHSLNAAEIARTNIESLDKWSLHDKECQDSYLANTSRGQFGVFDGAGGVQGGREASMTARDAANGFLMNPEKIKSGKDLATVMDKMNIIVAQTPRAGISTGVLAQVVQTEAGRMLAYASMGDSRMYIVDKSGNVRMITKDEGEGHRIWNSLGHEECRCRQYGDVRLAEGDRVVLCSDGITGDTEKDAMSEAELGWCVTQSNNDQGAARNLLLRAKKRDDRTALVFSV